MTFEELRRIENEADRVNKTYDIFNEDDRLNRGNASRVEFLTTVHYIEQYLKPGDRILDLGAGAGQYSIYFARRGYSVCALELADSNIKAFRAKLADGDDIDLVQGNALELGRYADESFDAVLVFGPLYHLENRADRLRVIEGARRVCKKDGRIFFAFISNDFVILTEFGYNRSYFANGEYDKRTFRLNDFPFVFHTVDACRELLADAGVSIEREIAADTVAELMEKDIDALSDEDFAQFMRYHFYICEKKEFLGMTNHLLFVGR